MSPDPTTGDLGEQNAYESQSSLNEYLLFHYGSAAEILPYDFGPHDAVGFPYRTVREHVDERSVGSHARALDVGCAVGRSSFELARFCAEVIGVDFSHSFVSIANDLAERGSVTYERLMCGEITEPLVARVPDGIDRTRVTFRHGDACDLPRDLGAFDVVHASNLLCRLPDPMRFLERLPELVHPSGQLVMATPCTWMELYTPKERWIGCSAGDGRRTLEVLKEVLEPAFDITGTTDMPFLIREHERKFQWSVSQVSTWRRR